MESSRFLRALACLLLFSVVGAIALAGNPGPIGGDPNLCDFPGEEPDIIVGNIYGPQTYGSANGISAYSFGTESCNIGTCHAVWDSGAPGNHPVIAQNMFRLKDGRLTHIGQSWLKHGFATLNGGICETPGQSCYPTNGQYLGVNCSDPYGASLNGSQSNLGPKSEVLAYPGTHDHPYTGQGQTGNVIYKRLQVHHGDLDATQNPGATYILEAQYVTFDDAAAANNFNNNSYRTINVSGPPNYNISVTGSTVREAHAMDYWRAQDPTIFVKQNSAAGDGFFMIGSQAYDLGGGLWRYEYAIQNVTSDRSARRFTIPVPASATISSVGFHDVDYHSNEIWDGTDWAMTVGATEVTWETLTFATDPNANALRWGTMYSFWFTTDVAPVFGSGEIELFVPGTSNAIAAGVKLPDPNGTGSGAGAGESDGLLLAKGLGSNIALSWNPSCLLDDDDYEIYEGSIGSWASHIPTQCSTSGATSATITPSGGDRYYLIVPRAGAIEGSYGSASDGDPRAISGSACTSNFPAPCE